MASTILLALGLLAGVTSASDFPNCKTGPLANSTVCDPTKDAYIRAQALVALLTLDEKIANTGNTSPGIPRLGLPSYEWWNEALHGVASSPGVSFTYLGNDYSYATSFPQPIIMGAAFDDELIHSVAIVVSMEARAFSNGNHSGLNFWTPNINPYKDPRWGRGQETPGEDAFHLSSYVYQLITGLEGGVDKKPYPRVVATCKHYAGYDLENWQGNERCGFDAIIDSQDLREYYMPPFQSCARDAKVQSVMCSFNAVNGVPTCADPYLLQTLLREYWGWNQTTQWVTSDCDAVQNIYNATGFNTPLRCHNYTKTPEEAVAVSLNAGTDLDCGTFYPDFLNASYHLGQYTQATLDRSMARRYASLVSLGYFDAPENQPYRQLTFKDVSTNASQALALRAAEEGIVLLKNDGILPLPSSVKTIAMIGPWASATHQMQGSYYGVAPYLHSPVYAAQAANYSVSTTIGADINTNSTAGFAAALTMAKQADAVVYLGGIDTTIEGEGQDRNNITWPGNQLDLIAQLAQVSKVTVVQMGNQVDSSSLVSNQNVSAIVWAGYPGQDGGTAIMNILRGKTAPSGRLPVTQYPGNYVNEVPMTNMSLRSYISTNYSTNNPGRTYRFYTGKAVFPFGHGLHYTNFTTKISSSTPSTFAISSLVTSNSSAKFLDQIPFTNLTVEVTNTGSIPSSYVLLAFLAGKFGPAPYPIKTLVAYDRVHHIPAGSKKTGTLKLDLGRLARVDEQGSVVLYPGDYSLSLDVHMDISWNFTLTGEPRVLEVWPVVGGNVTSGIGRMEVLVEKSSLR